MSKAELDIVHCCDCKHGCRNGFDSDEQIYGCKIYSCLGFTGDHFCTKGVKSQLSE